MGREDAAIDKRRRGIAMIARLRRAWAAFTAAKFTAPAPAVADVAEARRKLSISLEALALASIKSGTNEKAAQKLRERTFKWAEPAPGVLPKAEAAKLKIAMDEAGSWQDAFNFATISAVGAAYAEGLQFMGYPYLAELTQRSEYRRPAEIIAREMTRKWIKLQSTGDDAESKADRLKELEAELKRLDVQAVFRKAIEHDGFYGRAQVYVDVGTNPDDREELKSELFESKAKIKKQKGFIKRLQIVEPIWTYPNFYNANNPLDPAFFRPKTWFVMGMEIHSSRFLTFVSREVPDLLKPSYAFGGLSLSQMLKPYVDNWLRTRQSVSDLIHSFSIFVLKTDMSAVLQGGISGDVDEVFKRIDLFCKMRDNRGAFILNESTEDFSNVSAPLGSLDHLQAQAQEHQSSVTGIPFLQMFGISPSGLNANGQSETDTFQDWCAASQESHLTPNLTRLINLIQLSLWGEIDPEIGFIWNPLHSLNSKEAADLDKQKADTDAVRISNSIIDAEEARERLAADKDGPYASLDLTKEIAPPDGGAEADAAHGLTDETGKQGEAQKTLPPGAAAEDFAALDSNELAEKKRGWLQ